MMEEKILYKEESYKIIGICMNIHSTMGIGFLEAVYCEVLEKEFIKNNIPYQREVKLDLYFNGDKLEKKYKADFLCFYVRCGYLFGGLHTITGNRKRKPPDIVQLYVIALHQIFLQTL